MGACVLSAYAACFACRDYCAELRDSLDLVVIGAWYGNGRKAGWLSPFLLAAWDPEAEQFQSVCRCMSGFTDQFYAEVRGGPTGRACRAEAVGGNRPGCRPSCWPPTSTFCAIRARSAG